MTNAPVVIVGAGPSGLVLALSLARHGVSSTILERETGITEDPRGVFLAGDANRILQDLGSNKVVEEIRFHKSSFKNPPFITVDIRKDTLKQVVPDGVLQIQPRLEHALRTLVSRSPFCNLREGCEVTGRTECGRTSTTVVHYRDPSGSARDIACTWLVGADGKKGIVRKKFLEPTAGIRQETGLFAYEGTWIAANLRIKGPTPQSHPDFPLWALGYTPEQVYDLFWPRHWHFCSPPGSPTACGRFGPHADRIWRHEIAVPNDWAGDMDAEEMLLGHLLPMVTRTQDENGESFPCGEVAFPRECIEVLRCRSFRFAQKVVNRWFFGRTILTGDAAHVFPPFGGQGIACGIRDAYALAWRLAALLKIGHPPEGKAAERLLTMWSEERRQGVDDSTRLTRVNGLMCNNEEGWLQYAVRKAMDFLVRFQLFGFLKMNFQSDSHGYKPTKNGFFLEKFGGGPKLAQVYVQARGQEPVLSDELLRRQTILTLLIIGSHYGDLDSQVKESLRRAKLPQELLSEKSIAYLSPDASATTQPVAGAEPVFHLCKEQGLSNLNLRPGYDAGAYMDRIGTPAKFAILRPDCIVFEVIGSVAELEQCLVLLGEMIEDDV
ncbi:uncharacterized protein E0L32_004512 [Thyridium curvatum]|uniref:FAD-binding domain-containing protein n=1 Tax=Thyridium curvatum TaxID=1093900 RepID=A0A507AWS7_9PEZI|nr:uncharacterized protein E0L32_004512 [Thyridium curvatum]TPX15235.1 hypothetical protein E0L32_004512 [Thyridium curvatum]